MDFWRLSDPICALLEVQSPRAGCQCLFQVFGILKDGYPTTCLGNALIFIHSYKQKSFIWCLNGVSCSPVCGIVIFPALTHDWEQLHFLKPCPSGSYFDKISTKPSPLEIKQCQLPQPFPTVFITYKEFSKELQKCNHFQPASKKEL